MHAWESPDFPPCGGPYTDIHPRVHEDVFRPQGKHGWPLERVTCPRQGAREPMPHLPEGPRQADLAWRAKAAASWPITGREASNAYSSPAAGPPAVPPAGRGSAQGPYTHIRCHCSQNKG